MRGPLELDEIWLERIRQSVNGLEFGQVQIIIHDGRIVQIERIERKRYDTGSGAILPGASSSGSRVKKQAVPSTSCVTRITVAYYGYCDICWWRRMPRFLSIMKGSGAFQLYMELERMIRMSYQQEHQKWLNYHLAQRNGERLDALKRGHGYGNQLFAEQIWWPIAGHFHGLHPEHEVKDWRGRSYFVDFMWIAGIIRIVFEIMDYGSHGTDRSKYRSDLNRGLYLQSQDCMVFYISLDELKENPSFILSVVRNILWSYRQEIFQSRTGFNARRYSAQSGHSTDGGCRKEPFITNILAPSKVQTQFLNHR